MSVAGSDIEKGLMAEFLGASVTYLELVLAGLSRGARVEKVNCQNLFGKTVSTVASKRGSTQIRNNPRRFHQFSSKNILPILSSSSLLKPITEDARACRDRNLSVAVSLVCAISGETKNNHASIGIKGESYHLE